MPSPFPGMDPYLEAHWRDVHTAFVVYTSEALNQILPQDLVARINDRIAPQVEPLGEPLEEGFIEILDIRDGRRIVTIIELLTPADKIPGPGADCYRRRQIEIGAGTTSLVEIDLLRSGRHMIAVAPEKIPRSSRTPYMVCVRRGWARANADRYCIPLSQKLPTIAIPLRQTDARVPVDLQALIERCYHHGRYDGDLDYRADPDPPLSGEEAEWADQLLRSKGLRTTRP